jgi:hypothetical protein
MKSGFYAFNAIGLLVMGASTAFCLNPKTQDFNGAAIASAALLIGSIACGFKWNTVWHREQKKMMRKIFRHDLLMAAVIKRVARRKCASTNSLTAKE